MIRFHGTYPMDSGRWRNVRSLPLQEVADLLKVELTPRQREDAKEFATAGVGGAYLWLNKGFVLLKDLPVEAGAGEKDLFSVACAEQICQSPSIEGIEAGDQAVYLADGSYYLIECVQ